MNFSEQFVGNCKHKGVVEDFLWSRPASFFEQSETTKETTSPIWSNAEYIYSENEYEPGYVRTGKATYVRTCVRDDGRSNPDQNPNTMK